MANREQKQQKIQQYLQNKVTQIFERLMIELLSAQPEHMIDWCIQWLDTKGRQLDQKIRSTSGYSQVSSTSKPQNSNQTKKATVIQHSDSEDDEADDEIEELPQNMQQKIKNGNMRTSVSAEVYGQFNKKENFKPRVIEKGQEQKDRIVKRLMQSFMFQALDDKERDIVVNAMEEKKYNPGDWIIRQGEDGDNLYVVDQGELDCYKTFKKDEGDKYLKTYQPGESFGELALLYNAPRAASIKAKNQAILFALDRATFNNIVKDAAVKKRERYEDVLKKIDLLSSMDPYERTHVCDGIKEQKFKKGEYVIKQGDKGDKFYMIEEGELVATKKSSNGNEQSVYSYKSGDYFGELALMKDIPRQANVIAQTDVKLVYLDSAAFRRLLGPLDEILKRNSMKYEQYLKENQ